MIFGAITAILFLFSAASFITRRNGKGEADYTASKGQRILSVTLLITALLHLVAVSKLLRQRPPLMILLGVLLMLCLLVAVVVPWFFHMSRPRRQKVYQAALVVFVIGLVAHIGVGLSSFSTYRSQVLALNPYAEIGNVSNGTYIGECDAGYIYVKVRVTVQGGRMTDIALLEHRNEHGTPAEAIIERVLQQQSLQVDRVSGATNSSKVILQAVENALKQGRHSK